jgi:hypothetical protein
VDGFRALVSLHDRHRNKTPQDSWGLVDSSVPWTPAQLDLGALVDHILAGKAWIACQLRGERSDAAAGASNLLVLDFDGHYKDGDLSLEDFWANERVARHCAFTYTSCSHTAEAHRFRAVFLAPEMATGDLHRAAYHCLIGYLGLTPADKCGEKAERLWYGNDQAEVRFGQGEILPSHLLLAAEEWLEGEAAEAAAAAAAKQARAATDDGRDPERIAWVLRHILNPSQEGEYEYWVSVLNAAAASGSEQVREAFFDWHARGFHGNGKPGKPAQRMNQRRYERAGKKAEFGYILKLAKQQQGAESCNVFLPDELKYGGRAPVVLLASAARASEIGGPAPLSPGPITAEPPPLEDQPDVAVTAPLASSFSAADWAPNSGGHRPGGPSRLSHKTSPPPPPSKAEANRAAKAVLGAPGTITPLTLASDYNRGEAKSESQEAIDIFLRQLRRLYLLLTHSILETDGDLQEVEERRLAGHIALVRNDLLAYTEFNRSPQLLEIQMLDLFRQEHAIERRRFADVTPVRLTGQLSERIEWLLPGFLAEGLDHIVYSKAGIGKTTLALQWARRIIGDPEAEAFLDSGPLRNHHHWRQRQVLFIASDGAGAAHKVLDHYVRQMGQSGADWLQYLTVWCDNEAFKSPAWSLTLRHLRQLHDHLALAQKSDLPVAAVIVDSCKAVCDGAGFRIGDQIYADYFQLVQDICRHFRVTLIWLHHEAKDGSGAQGVAGITERPSGVMRMKQNENHLLFCVEKLRGGKPREIACKLGEDKDLEMIGYAEDQQDDATPADKLLSLIEWHHRRFLQQASGYSGSAADRIYPGLQRGEIVELAKDVRSHGLKGLPKSDAQIKRLLASLINDGLLLRKGFRYTLPSSASSDLDTQASFSGEHLFLDDPED